MFSWVLRRICIFPLDWKHHIVNFHLYKGIISCQYDRLTRVPSLFWQQGRQIMTNVCLFLLGLHYYCIYMFNVISWCIILAWLTMSIISTNFPFRGCRYIRKPFVTLKRYNVIIKRSLEPKSIHHIFRKLLNGMKQFVLFMILNV